MRNAWPNIEYKLDPLHWFSWSLHVSFRIAVCSLFFGNFIFTLFLHVPIFFDSVLFGMTLFLLSAIMAKTEKMPRIYQNVSRNAGWLTILNARSNLDSSYVMTFLQWMAKQNKSQWLQDYKQEDVSLDISLVDWIVGWISMVISQNRVKLRCHF